MDNLPEWIEPQDPSMPDPSVQYYDEGSTVKQVDYFGNKIAGIRYVHRTDGPATIRWNREGIKTYESWHKNGEFERADGPAIVSWDLKGLLQREEWLKKSIRHRVDGPAYVKYTKGTVTLKEWWQDGLLHRTDGPATIEYTDLGEVASQKWYRHGKEYDPENGELDG